LGFHNKNIGLNEETTNQQIQTKTLLRLYIPQKMLIFSTTGKNTPMKNNKSFADMLLEDVAKATDNNPEQAIEIHVWAHGKLSPGKNDTAFTISVKARDLFVDKSQGVIFTRITKTKGQETSIVYKSLPIKDIRKVKIPG
jgi:hypothetical protein